MTRLPRLVLEGLNAELKPLGFRLVKRDQWFVRTIDDRTERFHLIFLKYSGEYVIRPVLGIRFEQVENIFHRTSGLPPTSQKSTDTVALHLPDARGGHRYELELHAESEIPEVVGRLIEIFHQDAEPYFAEYSTLEALDRSLNDHPRKRSVHSLIPSVRCSNGIIVAKLVGRPNFDELASIYREEVQVEQSGSYLPKFEALLEDLRNLKTEPSPTG